MIKASTGTASVLGLKKTRLKDAPTTAYFMLGEKCTNNCLFCSQSKNSSSDLNLLSRVAWSEYPESDIFSKLDDAYKEGSIKRACLQVVQGKNALNDTLSTVQNIKRHSDIPICSSAEISNPSDIDLLISEGADKVCIAIDAVTKELFKKIKGKDLDNKLTLLEQCANKHPGKLTSHLIVGLGETEYDIINMIQWLIDRNITVALFAFTPIKGTQMENIPQPPLDKYRRIQIANYLISNKHCSMENLEFEDKKLSKINLSTLQSWKDIILKTNGAAFRTSGCSDCNRPYYNESPLSTMYNYPRPLDADEILKAINDSNI